MVRRIFLARLVLHGRCGSLITDVGDVCLQKVPVRCQAQHFYIFSGAAGAGIITAGLWFYAVEVHPATVSQAKTGTFVNELFIFGLFINKASTKFNESLVRRGAG